MTSAESYIGQTIVDSEGAKIGKVSDVYQDTATGKPEWAAVSTGMFGSHVSLVPLAAVIVADGGELRATFDKQKVKDAPHSDPDSPLSEEQEAQLFDYYGVPYGGPTVTATGGPGEAQPAGAPQTEQATGYDTSGPTTDDAMTRSEERLHVGTERVEAGRARLRKYVVTEHVTQTVPVTHEEVRIEREPITDANVGAAMDGPAISEEEHEVVLHAERPVVAKETVPVERVRLSTDEVTEQATVDEDVRREEIDSDGVYPTGSAQSPAQASQPADR
jgi:uncharacterized protein (TIGR02271 family)